MRLHCYGVCILAIFCNSVAFSTDETVSLYGIGKDRFAPSTLEARQKMRVLHAGCVCTNNPHHKQSSPQTILTTNNPHHKLPQAALTTNNPHTQRPMKLHKLRQSSPHVNHEGCVLRIACVADGELRDTLDNAAHRNRRPLDWQAQGIPLLWWRAVLVSLIMRPKREVVDGAVSLAAEAGWSLGEDCLKLWSLIDLCL